MEKLRKVTGFGCTNWIDGIIPALQGYLNSFHRGIGCTPNECWNETKKNKVKAYVRKYRKPFSTKSKIIENRFVVGDMVLCHDPLGRSNKLEADYNYSGVILHSSFGSAYVRLEDGRIIRSSFKNLKKIL
ncbi:hypothetical protein NGRA_3509 [Nosema granulosis]|uniref:Uncharacterized protein n=1 Tax=Nosema granulosis TaxID=83296 RepID=A0A9P6KX38_9MICR|nr:hypothetical protein NGRA_3509 [Nosema granulosis]